MELHSSDERKEKQSPVVNHGPNHAVMGETIENIISNARSFLNVHGALSEQSGRKKAEDLAEGGDQPSWRPVAITAQGGVLF